MLNLDQETVVNYKTSYLSNTLNKILAIMQLNLKYRKNARLVFQHRLRNKGVGRQGRRRVLAKKRCLLGVATRHRR